MNSVTRNAHAGGPIGAPYRVTEMWLDYIDDNIPTVPVNSIREYELGCKEHRACFGHICSTSSGILLSPHSMSMRTSEIASEYHKASKIAFAGDKDAYLECIKRTNYTKNGTMRSITSTPTAGSARLIATPHDRDPHDVYISRALASKLKFCGRTWEGNVQSSVFALSELVDGQKVYVGRPPALSWTSCAPFTVRFWDKDCAGIHPSTFSAMHGDYDGDEIHIYPVVSESGLAEHASWKLPELPAFAAARALVQNDSVFDGSGRLRWNCDNVPGCIDFLSYTTLSAKQIMENKVRPILGSMTRNKHEMIDGTSRRFLSPDTEDNFVADSIRGMGDICRQQLSQGIIGDMSRVAKIVASCFHRPPRGGLYISGRDGQRCVMDDGLIDAGCSALRGMSIICGLAQQAALDAHRATSTSSQSHDFIADIVLGPRRENFQRGTWEYTYMELENAPARVLDTAKVAWKYTSGTTIKCLVDPFSLARTVARHVSATYNPVILSAVRESRRHRVAQAGVTVVCNYYGARLTELELRDVAYMYTHLVEKSQYPITSRSGLLARDLSWIETLEATDYTKLHQLVGCKSRPSTIVSSMFMGNFNEVSGYADS